MIILLTLKKIPLEIIDGPNKLDLIMAFAYAFDDHFFVVQMQDNNDVIHPVALTTISHRDGSGKSFYIEGMTTWHDTCFKNARSCSSMRDLHHRISGYYNTHTRAGCLEVELYVSDV